MNPLNRRMFRQPGMSRQPAGILASSPQLANTVANRQPVRMANGGLMMSDVQRLVQNKDIRSLAAISQDRNVPSSLRLVAKNAAERLSNAQNTTQVSTEPTVQNVSVPKSDAGSLASPPIMSVRGSGDTVALKAAPPMMSYDGPSEGALARRAALSNAPSKIKEGLSKGIGDIKTGLSEAFAVPERTVSKPKDPAEIRSSINSAIASLVAGPRFLQSDNIQKARNKYFAEDEIDFEPNVDIKDPFDDPNDFVPEGPGETMAEIASSRDTVGTDGSDTAGTTPTTGKPRKVGTVDPDAPPPKGGAQDAKKSVGGGRLMDSIYGSTVKTSELTKTLEADIKKVLTLAETGRTEDKKATDAAKARLKKATDVFDKALGTKMAKAKEFNLEDVRDEALKISGVDDSNYDESRKDAFWMGLMRAGLAIAAGESDNALSNVAKGLGVGLEGYGKDIATLNEQEREDRKEIRAISMDLIKTKNAREIALATAKNDYTFNQQRLAQAAVQGADAAVIAAQNRENTNKLTGLQLQANLNLQLATRKADDKKLAVDTAYKQWAAEISMLPTEAKQALMFGPVEYDENGSIKLSALQEKEYKKILDASTTNKTTVTDTLRSITNAAANGQIRGVKLSDDSTTAQVQASQWFSVYQKEYENAAKDPLIDENKILDAFAKDIGGTAPSGSGNNTLQPGQVIDISNHPQKDSLMAQKENEPFKIKGVDVVRKGSTIVALSPTK